MPPKKPKLDHPVTQINVGILPREILCIVFSHLEEKSMRSASKTCKLWFELIRNDSNWSSHIFLKYNGLKELQAKIERSEWIWDRWPVLKVIELGPLSENIEEPKSVKEAVDLVKLMNFKECSTLEKVICSVKFDLEEFYPDFCSELKFANIEQLTFNPHHVFESFGTEQISVLHIDLDLLSRLIDTAELTRLNQNISKCLNDSIKTVKLTVRYHAMIHDLQNVCDFVTDLCIKELPGRILKRYDFEIIPMFQQFKRMRKCHVNLPLWTPDEWLYFEKQGPIIVDEKFQDMTEVTFVFNCFTPMSINGSEKIFEAVEVTKKPFKISVTKPIRIHTYS